MKYGAAAGAIALLAMGAWLGAWAGAGLQTAAPKVAVHGAAGEYDFGFLEPGALAHVVFVITNPLERPLAIRDIKRECDCTAVAVQAPATIGPGGSLALAVAFTAPQERSNYVTRVILLTDDPSRRILPLALRSTIGLPLTFVPRRVNLGTLAPGQKRTCTVKLTNASKSPVALTDITVKGPQCQVSATAATVPAGGQTEVTVAIEAAAAPRNYEVRICIETDSADQPQVDLPVEYSVAGGAGGTGR